MSRGFGSTFGNGTNDVIRTASLSIFPTKTSFSCWLYKNAFGGFNAGTVLDSGSGSSSSIRFISAFTFGFNARFTGNTPQWTIGQSNIPTGVWTNFCMSYDGSSTSNIPVMYINGISKTVTTQVASSGTINPVSGSQYIGNRSDGATNWDGMLGHMGLWNGVLITDADALALASGINPMELYPSLVSYMSLDGINKPEVDLIAGLSGAITGTRLGTSEPPVMPLPYLQSSSRRNGLNNYNFISSIVVPAPPPPTNNPYVIGSSMVQLGTSILLQGTSPLINKGTVRDALNVMPH